ncbi:MAG: RagB/SusD family nutrient uptake outer membrane protein [Bacteroides sp.]|nr:RagB/SusD family nutrient uptake outer membrane protein [Bacteroides sp.]
MKKIIYIASFLITSVCMTGCEDFLTVESPDQLTSSTFWRNESDAEAGLASAYAQLEYSVDQWEFPEVKWPVEAFREDIVNLGADAFGYKDWVALRDFTYNNGNSQLSKYWRNNYRGISYSNQVIEMTAKIKEGNISLDKRTLIINEAHFLRAYYHMKLILNWEQIVIRDEYITSQDKLSKPLSTREAAWDFIIEDLKKATALPAKRETNNIGRATSGAANAYLGFAYLTRAYEIPEKKAEYLAEAIKAFDAVKGYELEKNFLSMFNATNKNCKESIFELQFSMKEDGGAYYKISLPKWIATAQLGGWDEILPSESLVDEFKKEGEIATTGRLDTRAYESIFFRCDYFNDGNGHVYGFNYDEVFSDDEGKLIDRPAFRKFLPKTLEDLNNLTMAAINVPLMRYANVLLMKAEAHNELGHPELAIPLINKVREVHGDMPAMKGTTQTEVRAQIEHERIIEFPLENFRFYDLRRWGKTQEALKKVGRDFNPSENNFFPIPLTEINTNDQIKQ